MLGAYEPRGSRTVLGAREGEIPSRDSACRSIANIRIFERDGLSHDRSPLAAWVGESSALLEPLVFARNPYCHVQSRSGLALMPLNQITPLKMGIARGSQNPDRPPMVLTYAMSAPGTARRRLLPGISSRRTAGVNIPRIT